MRALFDSDILIDYLQGIEKAKREIDLHDEKSISLVSWMEVMCGTQGQEEEIKCRGFLNRFITFPISQPIAEKAVFIRKKYNMKLPDAIIWATAQEERCLMVTRNIKDFPKGDPSIRVPYKV